MGTHYMTIDIIFINLNKMTRYRRIEFNLKLIYSGVL